MTLPGAYTPKLYCSNPEAVSCLNDAVKLGKFTEVFVDNAAAIAIGNQTTVSSKRGRYINIKFMNVREKILDNIIKLVYVKTDDQLADMLTKNLAKTKFLGFRKLILME